MSSFDDPNFEGPKLGPRARRRLEEQAKYQSSEDPAPVPPPSAESAPTSAPAPAPAKASVPTSPRMTASSAGDDGSLKARFCAWMRKMTDPARLRKKNLPSPAEYPAGEVPLWVSDPEHYTKRLPTGKRVLRMTGRVVLDLILILCMFGVAALGGVAAVVYSFSDTELDERFASMDLDYSSFIYATNPATGENYVYQEIQSTSGTRVWVSDTEIPQFVRDATVAIEDKRFYQHIGVDPLMTGKATFKYAFAKLTGKATGGIAGGSTLTQQVIKNITGNDDNSPLRKIKEMLQALYIERRYTKDQILEYYLNTVYFGEGANGISAAADVYFDKTPEQLTVVEAAAIICITKSPSYYDPVLHPDHNEERRALVLWNMYDQGYITEAEYQEYINTDLILSSSVAASTAPEEEEAATDPQSVYNYYSDMVIRDVLSDLQTEKGYTRSEARNLLYHGGLQIYSCVDPEIQQIMEDYFTDETNYEYKNASKDVIVVDEATGKTEAPQTAMLVMDPDDGRILGVIGGRGAKNESMSLNRACDSPRQPGSSIKPLSIYGYALEKDILTEGTPLDDSPVQTTRDGKTIWPSNYAGTYAGLVSTKKALSWSLNAPAARALKMVGVSTSYDFMVNTLHFTTLCETDKSSLAPLAVGSLTKGATLREMVTGYTVFAGGGMYTGSRSYSKVVSYDGKTVLEKVPERESVFSEQTAYLMTDILNAALKTGGTSDVANLKPIATAGKSGTTSYFKDRWFIGYTPDYLGGIWWGYDTPNTLENTHHVKMWHDVMQKIHTQKGITESEFKQPSGLVTCSVCWKSGLLPNECCSSDQQGSAVQKFLYKEGTQPTKSCTVHHQMYVCTASGQLAHDGCPKSAVVLKTFVDIQRSFNCEVTVGDAGYICPKLTSKDKILVSDTLPVYANMIPEKEVLPIPGKGVRANVLCTVHKKTEDPHLFGGTVAPPSTDTSTSSGSGGTTTNTGTTTDTHTDTSSGKPTDTHTTDTSSVSGSSGSSTHSETVNH